MREKNCAVWLLNKFAIAFLVLCVFAFEFPVMGIPLRYFVIAGLFVLSLMVCPKEFNNPRFIRFMATIGVSYTILMAYSVIVKLNTPENFFFFVKPFLVFLVIPAFSYLFRVRGPERYLNAFTYAMCGLIVLFLYILVRTAIEPGYGLGLNDKSKLLIVVVYDFLPRIVFENFVFLVPMGIYLMAKSKGVKMHLCFFAMIFIALLSQTLGIVGALIVAYMVTLYRKKSWGTLIPLIIAFAVGYFVYTAYVADTIMATKGDSADYKADQVRNFDKDMGVLELAFGRGLGCEFKDFDQRHLTEPIIEVVIVQMFQSGGFFFIWLIIFPYLLPVIPYVISRKGDKITQVLSLSQACVFAASLANPYIWSGSVGLLFMMLFEAHRASLIKVKNV